MRKDSISFTERERNDDDNCVFFASLDYAQDQFEIDLSRKDFEHFKKRKTIHSFGSGVRIPEIPYVIDDLLKPYTIGVTAILFQIGALDNYRSQLNIRNLPLWFAVQRFINDSRNIETNNWNFPFIALLSGRSRMSHVEYIKDQVSFERVMEKVGGNEGKIPLSIKLDRKTDKRK